MAIIERSLDDALRAAKLDKLPPLGTKEGSWSKAIALVTRSVGGIQSYAIVEKKADGTISVKNDCGFAYFCSGIKGFAEFYPIDVLPENNSDKAEVTWEEVSSPAVDEKTEKERKLAEIEAKVNDYWNNTASIDEAESEVVTSTEEAERLAKLPMKGTERKTTASRTTKKRGRPSKRTTRK